MPVLPVTDATFEDEVLRSDLPVLIDFYADWCEPCKQLSPIVEEIERELDGKLKVVKVDVDHNPNVAAAFRVQSLPTLFVVNEGRVVGGQPGLLPKEAILQMVEPLLPADASQIDNKTLAQLIQDQRAQAVDIRDAHSFGRARVPGAVHIPAADVVSRKDELKPTDGRVRVLYDRSTDGAKTAADSLSAAGVEVGFLDGGFLFWEADGCPVERPDDED